MTALDTTLNPSPDSPCPNCETFLNWSDDEKVESESEKAVIFRSLVAIVKLQPELDDSLEAKAVKFLDYVQPFSQKCADPQRLHIFANHLQNYLIIQR
ncbi:hypothetical protein BLNAU_18550 [Blattamonas nauphoetae]|uniref:Uncharacterized protein n=1 Tax=Blattamonas nauphoetae TaxID=2049346 RepID=A0ABQ9X3Y7_9EUKA|nr:hypothetical protein BLNAU_18550 [Blattamonas nauphoetae]